VNPLIVVGDNWLYGRQLVTVYAHSNKDLDKKYSDEQVVGGR